MKIAAIICEYNPFHNGHIYQIKKTKEELNVDAVLAIMSGNFVQRGLPSAFSKYERAKIACEYGCDLVIELPIFSAIAPADIFSKNAVNILNKLNLINYLSFGSEDNLATLKKAKKIMIEKKYLFDKLMKKNLSSGLSYSRSYANSFNELTETSVMSKSNNILAYNYLSALAETKSDIKAFSVQRLGPNYNESASSEEFASASYIRKLIYEKKDVSKFLPKLPSENIIDFEKYFSYIKAIFLRENRYENYYEYNIDTINFIEKNIYDAKYYKDFIVNIGKKNFSKSNINRFLLSMLLNIHRDDISRNKDYDFIIPLCANEKGREILSEIKNCSQIKIISKYKDIYELSENSKLILNKMISLDKIYYFMKDMNVKDAYKINLLSTGKIF